MLSRRSGRRRASTSNGQDLSSGADNSVPGSPLEGYQLSESGGHLEETDPRIYAAPQSSIASINSLAAGLGDLRVGNSIHSAGTLASAQSSMQALTPMISNSSAQSSAAASRNAVLGSVEASAALNNELKNYVVKKPVFFQTPGRVLVVMWSEPAGPGARSARNISVGAYGAMVHTKPRYFLILKAFRQNCLAIAIHTYGSQGLGRGHIKEHHGVAFHRIEHQFPLPSERAAPGEAPMQPLPIRILPDLNIETLAATSRINYSKMYTIEYNIPVRPFGMVPSDFRPALYQQFTAVTGVALGVAPAQSAAAVAPPAPVAPAAAGRLVLENPEQIRALHQRLMRERGLDSAAAQAIIAAMLRQQQQQPSRQAAARTAIQAAAESSSDDDSDESEEDSD